MKVSGSREYNNGSKAGPETSSSGDGKSAKKNNKLPKPPKDHIHVRARRGQATDIHSLPERGRREKINETMKILQDLVLSCNKLHGFLARKMGINSIIGSYLDPLADKVLIGCVAVVMVENKLRHCKHLLYNGREDVDRGIWKLFFNCD